MYDAIVKKIVSVEELERKAAVWRLKSQSITFTNGVFDLVHPGHVDYLFRAAELGHRLVVGLNSDASVKTLQKGSDRPINDQQYRAFILAAFGAVDAVVIFDDSTPQKLIETLKPDVLVKGGDYDPESTDQHSQSYIVGSETVRKHDGKVAVIPFLEGFSSTAVIEKIRGNGKG